MKKIQAFRFSDDTTVNIQTLAQSLGCSRTEALEYAVKKTLDQNYSDFVGFQLYIRKEQMGSMNEYHAAYNAYRKSLDLDPIPLDMFFALVITHPDGGNLNAKNFAVAVKNYINKICPEFFKKEVNKE